MRTFHVIISVLVACFTLRSHNEAQITSEAAKSEGLGVGVTHPSMDKARSFLSTYDVELRGRGAWGRFFFCRLPCRLFFLLRFFFFKTKIKGVEGVGPGSPELQTLSWGGGWGGALFLSLALVR